MLGPLFCYCLFFVCCLAGFVRPHVALIAYFGFATWGPQYIWRWTMPDPLEFQKYLAGIALLGFVANGLRGNRIKGFPLLANLGLGTYLLLAFISAQQSIYPPYSDWFMGIVWKIVLMAVVGTILLNSENKLLVLIWVCVLGQGHNAFEINKEYFDYGWSLAARNGWHSVDNNGYSILTVPVMAMSLALAFCSRALWQQMLAGIILVLQAHQIMLLESRGSMIGCVVLGGLFIYFVPKSPKTITYLVTGAILIAALAGPPVVAEFTSSFESGENLDSSADSRFKLWSAGYRITLDYPVLGVGPYAPSRIVPFYYEGGLATSNKALHNLIFDITCGTGIPSLLAYSAFALLPWWYVLKIWRKHRSRLSDKEQIVCLSVLTGIPGYWVSSMFSSGVLSETAYVLAVIAIAFLAQVQQSLAHTTSCQMVRASSSLRS